MTPRSIAARWWWLIACAIVILATLARVRSTHRVFSQTIDEPVHIAAGLDWLSGLPYSYDCRNPPLPRVLAALPLKLNGFVPAPLTDEFVSRGNQLLYARDQYVRNIARTRRGNLLLLAVAMIALTWWARRLFGRAVALVALLLFALLPPILGHAGLATTDLSIVATLTLALATLDWFLDAPSWRRAIPLGLTIGLGMLAKFTFFAFFPWCALAILLVRRRFPLAPLALAVLVGLLTVWAGYRFETKKIADIDKVAVGYVTDAAPAFARPLVRWVAQQVPLPAPSVIYGMAIIVVDDAQKVYDAYLFGEFVSGGFWYYFPVVTFFKTPIPFLILAAWGLFAILRDARRTRTVRGLELVAIAFIPFLALMRSTLNLGVRHVLPVYVPLAILAAYGLVASWRAVPSDAFGRLAAVALVGWLIVNGAAAHPDYLPWFNAAAGDEPGYVATDSNLDWGQDVLRLQQAVRERNITRIRVLYAGSAWLHLHDVPGDGLLPYTRHTGWIAISETAYRLENRHGEYSWLEKYKPAVEVGKGIRLYYIPE